MDQTLELKKEILSKLIQKLTADLNLSLDALAATKSLASN